MKQLLFAFLIATFFIQTSCGNATKKTSKETKVKIETEYGDLIVKLYNQTPLHRDNFIKLANEGFYDDLLFHRVINGFMIQGGDPDSKNAEAGKRLGGGDPGYTIPAEIDSSLFHKKGVLAAARRGGPGNPEKRSSGSQFYIVVSESGTAHLNGAYTVFGRVIKNTSVAETIVQQPRIDTRTNRPQERIKMQMKFVIKTGQEIKDEYGFDVE